MKASIGAKGLVATGLLALWLCGCGGGGGSSDAQASPSTPPPTGTNTPPSVQPAGDFVVFEDSNAGSFIKGPLDSSSWAKLADFKKGVNTLTTLASGGQLAIYQAVDAANESVSIYDVKSGQRIATQKIPKGTVVAAGPLFGKPELYLLRTFTTTATGFTDGNVAFVADLKAGTVNNTLASGGKDAHITALPDGRLYRIDKNTGAISTSDATGAWQPLGTLTFPANRTLGEWRVNHQGTKIAVQYDAKVSGGLKSDLWVANIDGANQYRVTNDGNIYGPVWAPDDSKLAFQFNTLSSMVGGSSDAATGQCSYWYVPAESRDVSGLVKGQPHAVAKQMNANQSGVKDFPVCNLVAWEK